MIYLDNAATSFPKAPRVGEEMSRYIRKIGANIGRGIYESAIEAGNTALLLRGGLAKLFSHTYGLDNIVFTSGATAGINQVLFGYLEKGDHVIVSSLEHNAVMRSLNALAEMGVEHSCVPVDAQGRTEPADIERCIRKNTRLMLFSHASNVSGALFPIEEAARIAYRHGIPIAIDAAQTAGCVPINFDKLRLDALIVPAHKGLMGPQGIGALLMSSQFACRLRPLIYGGTGSFSDSEIQPQRNPDKFESGTQNIPGIYGFLAAVQYILLRDVNEYHRQEVRLADTLISGISGLPLRVISGCDGSGALDKGVGIVSVSFKNVDNSLASFALESDYGIATRCGLHCSPAAHRALGTFPNGTVRFSFGENTTLEDIDITVQAIATILKD